MDSEPIDVINHELQLTEPLPEYPHLTIENIHDIVKGRFGLRATQPTFLESEVAHGIEGDFILLHDISRFLTIKEEELAAVLAQSGRTGSVIDLHEDTKTALVQTIFAQSDLTTASRVLNGLDTLPQRYEEAIRLFFAKRAMPLISGNEITNITTLQQYIQRLPQATPAMLLIRNSTDRLGYDNERYFGFSKHGKGPIMPEAIVDSSQGISASDAALLGARYRPHLLEKAVSVAGTSSRDRLYEHVKADVSSLLAGKVIGMLAKQVKSSPVAKMP